MSADAEFLDLFGKHSARPAVATRTTEAPAAEAGEARCPAFGYLRGLHDRALAVEFRLRNGNREYFPYALLGPWRHDPSAGILLKFAGGDVVNLVLIQGSNLDVLVNETVNLTDRGLQRHRISFIREMDEDELARAGKNEPTIDRIEIAEFESNEELKAYLKKAAPAFARPLNDGSG